MNIDAPTTCTITRIETKAIALTIVMMADGLRGAASVVSSAAGVADDWFFGFWFIGHGVALSCWVERTIPS